MPGYELIGESELEEIKLIFSNGGILFRQGFENLRNNCYKVKDFENQFTQKLDSKHSLAVTSGTAALRVALAALNIGPGDEVITSSFTFVATVEAIIESGAIPKCVNIDETLNIDPQDLRNNISSNTKAVIAIHMLGTPARLNEINAICKSKNLFLIEDTAWGCGAKFRQKYLGTWGDIATMSFYPAHHMTMGFKQPVPEHLRDDIGKTVQLTVKEIGVSEDAIAVKVDGYHSSNKSRRQSISVIRTTVLVRKMGE